MKLSVDSQALDRKAGRGEGCGSGDQLGYLEHCAHLSPDHCDMGDVGSLSWATMRLVTPGNWQVPQTRAALSPRTYVSTHTSIPLGGEARGEPGGHVRELQWV